jgi:hypothetical protein
MKRTVNRQNREQGVALIMALFALLLLSAIGVGMMYMANTESLTNQNYKDSEKAFWGARAGLEEVRARLFQGPTTAGDLVALAPGVLPGNANSILYVVRNTSLTPWTGTDTRICEEFKLYSAVNSGCTGSFPNKLPLAAWAKTPVVQAYTPGYNTNNPPFEWVRVTLKNNASNLASFDPSSGTATPFYVEGSGGDNTKEICWDGSSQQIRPSGYTSCTSTTTPKTLRPIYVLTAYAVTPSGASRWEQMEVANTPPFSSNAAVDSQDVVVLQGSLDISGFDSCSCVCPGGGTFCNAATVQDRSPKTCDRTKWAIYSQQGITQNGNGSLYAEAGTGLNATSANNDCQNGHGCFPYDIAGLIDTYKNMPNAVNATSSCYTGGPSPCGVTPALVGGTELIHLQGDPLGGTMPTPFPPTYTNGQTEGTPQITYYGDGNSLTLNSGSSGNGILIVDGDLSINGGFQWYGLILVRGIVSFTGGGSTQNVWGAVLNGTSITQNDVLGGSSTIAYDSCALANTQTPQPPKMISFREITY